MRLYRAFKERAVKLSYERSSITELATELGVLPDRIYSWRKEFSDYGGYIPASGSLYDTDRDEPKSTRNYKFTPKDEEEIKLWLRRSVLVNCVKFSGDFRTIEEELIRKYTPLLNIQNNPKKLPILEQARELCVQTAKTKR